MNASKIFLGIAFFSFLFACNNQQEQKPADDSVVINDTNKRRMQETVQNMYASIDISPMDMTYFPVDYPMFRMTKTVTQPPLARIIYSRPHLGGRSLFTEIQKYNEPWRLGANEATELDLYKNATIVNKRIPAGRYVLYCIPKEDKWNVIINSNIDTWGLHPDSTKDVANFEIPVERKNYRLEYFTMIFEKVSDTSTVLVMAWDDVEARLPIQF